MLENTQFDKMDNAEAANMLEQLLARFSIVLPSTNVYLCKIVQACSFSTYNGIGIPAGIIRIGIPVFKFCRALLFFFL